jgi:hypothetical protein
VLAGRKPPDRYCNVGADEQSTGLVSSVEAATNVIERAAVSRERVRREIYIAECDRARLYDIHKLSALTIDARVADRTARIVPDDKLRRGHEPRYPQLLVPPREGAHMT